MMAGCAQEITVNESHIPIALKTPPQTPLTPPRRSPNDVCFKCNGKGHWSSECPKKILKNAHSSSPGSSSSSASSNLPLIRCPCGQGVCRILTSNSVRNPGRTYYTCPKRFSEHKCGFFWWCDEVLKLGAPVCPCGAGVCSLNKEKGGEYAGHWYFACRIKKNQGACHFFQRVGPLAKHIIISGDECKDSHNSYTDCEVPNMQFNGLPMKDQNHELELEPPMEGSLYADTKDDKIPNENLVAEEPHTVMMGKVLSVMSQHNVSYRQSEFWCKITAAAADDDDLGTSLLLKGTHHHSTLLQIDFDSEVLNIHVYGWLGRLAFPPFQCLRHFPTVPYGCMFPSFGPISLAEDVNMFIEGPVPESNCASDGKAEIPPLRIYEGNEVGENLSRETFRENSSKIEGFSHANGTISILKQYGDKLLNFLETLEPCDHEEMLRIAEATFAMLSKRSVEFKNFQENVLQYINCTSTVSRIEGSMCKDVSSEKLINQYCTEKVHFDNVSTDYAKAMDSYNAFDSRLQLLTEEVSRVKTMLHKLEEELLCYEAETAKRAANVAEMSHNKAISETKLDAAYQEMEVALNLEQQKESTLEAAMEALERARSCL